jgi:glycosyltransferase involved in cell wall biosynthesis
MSRLAWFTPLPPARSGIAAYSAEILPLLSRRHQIDTFIDPHAKVEAGAETAAADLGVSVSPSRDFVWRHGNQPYDLVIYQLGNSTCHDYMWPYLVRFPGLVVLHDGQLHQARSRALLTSGRRDDYRTEFAFCHPDANSGIAEIVMAALGGSLYFLWPLVRVPIECSRLVACHSEWLAADLRATHPGQQFRAIEMGVADPFGQRLARRSASREGGTSDGASSVKARHLIPADRIVFAAFGRLTPEKRLSEILRGLRSVLPYAPHAHVMLVGQRVEYYDVEAEARAIGVAERVTVTGHVPDDELADYVAASDVCVCLRWPTSRETSASWLRCLAAGKPTIITDLAHTGSVPALDPRTWTTLEADVRTSDIGDRTPDSGPVCVAIDIVDEQHSLGLAMRRLAQDEALRHELGRRARGYWAQHHTLEHMADDYQRAIDEAIGRPAPDRAHLPAHLLPDGTGRAKAILGEFGLSLETLGWGDDR